MQVRSLAARHLSHAHIFVLFAVVVFCVFFSGHWSGIPSSLLNSVLSFIFRSLHMAMGVYARGRGRVR